MKAGGQRDRRRARREALHAARLAAAETPRSAAEVMFGAVRADIAKVPERAKDEAWKAVTRQLAIARRQIAALHSGPGTENARINESTNQKIGNRDA